MNDNILSAQSALVAAVREKRPVSGKYITMDTATLVRSVVADLGVTATIRNMFGRRVSNTKHVVEITLQKPIALVDTECYPVIYVTNSYAGESALTVSVGFHRLVCSNGMTIGSTSFHMAINHVGRKNLDKYQQLVETIKRAVEFACENLEQIAARANNHIASEDDLRTLLGVIKASPGLSKRITAALDAARPEDRTGPVDALGRPVLTLWNLWNIINEQMRKSGRSEVRQLERNNPLANTVLGLAV